MSFDSQTPMMKQYHAIRRELPPHTLLVFRRGDFYEMFGDDAREASSILNVALTKRGDTPMCGVPYHAARNYIEKLIAAGWRAAICDQVGEVQAGKLVRREVSQILSAGTLDDFGLDDRRPNYLAAICRSDPSIGVAFCELTTGEFRITEVADKLLLADELARILPAETIAPEEQRDFFESLGNANFLDGYIFDLVQAEEFLRDHFKVHSLAAPKCLAPPEAAAIPLKRVSHFGRFHSKSPRACPIARRQDDDASGCPRQHGDPNGSTTSEAVGAPSSA